MNQRGAVARITLVPAHTLSGAGWHRRPSPAVDVYSIRGREISRSVTLDLVLAADERRADHQDLR
jgi:hypothetical protein